MPVGYSQLNRQDAKNAKINSELGVLGVLAVQILPTPNDTICLLANLISAQRSTTA
jgi:hypothetical protein